MPFKPGQSGNPAGRIAGTPNALTKSIKDTVLEVFTELQNDPETSLLGFARKYPRDFMIVAAKLIPTNIKAEMTVPDGIRVIFNKDADCKPLGTDPEGNTSISGQ